MPQKQLLRRSSFFNKTVIFIFLTSLFFLILLLVGRYYFSIKEIEINIKEKINIKGFDAVYNSNLIFLDQNKLLIKLFELNPQVKITGIKKEFPNKLIVWASIEKPLASLQAVGGYFILAEDGRVIAKVKTKTNKFTSIIYYQKIDFSLVNTGQIIPFSDLKTSLSYLKKGLDLGLAINTLDIGGEDMIAFKLKGKEVIFSLKKDREAQIFQMETIIRQFRTSGQNYQKIDLRFDKPVITKY